jgi:NFU1 iron-sulfur cluster scaffold homolog, mitochondrial
MTALPTAGAVLTAGAVIPVHPQACPGRPDRLRWVTTVRAALPPFAGEVAAVPEPLGALLADGTLAGVELEPDAVVTRLAAGRSWAADGARVRSAVHAALERPDGWRPAAAPVQAGRRPEDVELEAVARELVGAGAVGGLARSHGGTIELLDVADGVVRVRMGGSCDGCPAAGSTLHLHLAAELRRRCAGFRELRAVADDGPDRTSGRGPDRAAGRTSGLASGRMSGRIEGRLRLPIRVRMRDDRTDRAEPRR